MKKIIFLGFSIITILYFAACIKGTTTKKGRYNIVDTGQNECFDSSSGAIESCNELGYDADYTGNTPS